MKLLMDKGSKLVEKLGRYKGNLEIYGRVANECSGKSTRGISSNGET